MDFHKKIRAIRGAEQLTREEFSSMAGISPLALDSVEQNRPYQKKTEQRILRLVESLGYELTKFGIEQIDSNILTVQDYMEVLDDAEVILRKGDILYFHCADDRRSTPEVTEKLQQMEGKGIILRSTYARGNDVFTTDPDGYRWIDADLVENTQVEAVYADRSVLQIEVDGESHFQIIKNKALADSRRNYIETTWNNGEKPCQQ